MSLALTISPQQSKQMLREDSELLQKNGNNLSGKRFRENIWHISKSKGQTIEMLSNTSRTKYQPFRCSLSQTPRSQNSYGYRYGKYKPGNLVQEIDIYLCSSTGGSKTHTSLHKKLILCKKNSKFTVSRNVIKICKELENYDKRHRNSVVSRGLNNTISQNSST